LTLPHKRSDDGGNVKDVPSALEALQQLWTCMLSFGPTGSCVHKKSMASWLSRDFAQSR